VLFLLKIMSNFFIEINSVASEAKLCPSSSEFPQPTRFTKKWSDRYYIHEWGEVGRSFSSEVLWFMQLQSIQLPDTSQSHPTLLRKACFFLHSFTDIGLTIQLGSASEPSCKLDLAIYVEAIWNWPIPHHWRHYYICQYYTRSEESGNEACWNSR